MKSTMQKKAARLGTLSLVVLALAVSGCRSATAPERHARPAGVVVTENGVEVVRVQGGAVTGSFVVNAGGQTGPLAFTFLDAQGNPITPPGDYHLDVRFANDAIAGFNVITSPYTFTGHIIGLQAGSTNASIRFMHGPPGHFATHADYTSQPVTVQVN
jgi:hypothetical protein